MKKILVSMSVLGLLVSASAFAGKIGESEDCVACNAAKAEAAKLAAKSLQPEGTNSVIGEPDRGPRKGTQAPADVKAPAPVPGN